MSKNKELFRTRPWARLLIKKACMLIILVVTFSYLIRICKFLNLNTNCICVHLLLLKVGGLLFAFLALRRQFPFGLTVSCPLSCVASLIEDNANRKISSSPGNLLSLGRLPLVRTLPPYFLISFFRYSATQLPILPMMHCFTCCAGSGES